MKLPKYMSVNYNGATATIGIKKWGIPIIMAKAMCKCNIAPWYMWGLAWAWIYPKCCMRWMLKKGE